ncbi:FAD-dependent oxidoreductase [Yunchengibacter salinarum]|uniref:FAD-dependent oxidoreductase n=1 Tax=Yunchengibacter salinarum TaxID=3133399 RepID=UPI0035B5CA25
MPYVPPRYEPSVPPAVAAGETEETDVAVVGAGPVGLALALDLARHGVRVVLLDRDTQLSDGSRAICYAKRTLEVMDRLGFGETMLDKGVSWDVGRVFFGDAPEPVYSFDLLPVKDQKFPGMINIQQYYNEGYNVALVQDHDRVDLRWGNEVVAVMDEADGVRLDVRTHAGSYGLRARWLVAADGCHSPIRKMRGIPFEGETFQDNFLIADVKFSRPYPSERHFWFDPPFAPGRSVLLHKQPDDVWRIDFQLGWDIDRDAVVKPENVTPRIRAMLGDGIDFEYEWISVYTFNCRKVDRMVDGRVIFAGDSAHLVSPFGARGANSGIQDADNLAWKLALVVRGDAPESLLASYDAERQHAARINILNSTRSTDFITPKSDISRLFRDSVLELARTEPFARAYVNSGRLSTPVPYPESPLNTPDAGEFHSPCAPGTVALDGPVRARDGDGWLLDHLGDRFHLLLFKADGVLDKADYEALSALMADSPVPVQPLVISDDHPDGGAIPVLADEKGLLARRYDARDGSCYLIRPDQHVAARMRSFDAGAVRAARDQALGRDARVAAA